MKKNLVGILKNSFFRRMTLVATVLALLVALSSCKHDKGGGNNPTPKIEEVTLTSVKVGSNLVTVKDVMDAGSTTDAEVDVEFVTKPSNATLSFAPTLKAFDEATKKGRWALNDGDNSIKITVTKDNKTKNYTLKIARNIVTPKITSITVGGHKKDGKGIVEYDDTDKKIIEIPVPTDFEGAEYEAKVSTDVEGATVEWEPALEDGKIKFGKMEIPNDLEKEFSVKVSKNGRESNYKVKVIMMTNIARIYGSRYMGKITESDESTNAKILKYTDDVDIELSGDKATISFASLSCKWKTVLYNGEDAKASYWKFKGLALKKLPLKSTGEKTKVKVILSNSEWEDDEPKEPWLATEEFNFNIACSSNKADAFISKVLVNDKDITDEEKEPSAFVNLFADDSNLAEFDSGKKASVAVWLSKKVEKVKINDTEILEASLTEEKNIKGDVIAFVATAKDIIVQENGTPTLVTIVVNPKLEDASYRETKMKFNLTYEEPPKFFPRSYKINGIRGDDIPLAFEEALIEGRNPPYSIETNYLVMNFSFQKKPKKVIMDIAGTRTESQEDQIVEIKTKYSTRYEVNLSGIVDASEKQVTLTFEPEDEGSFSSGEWKFKIRGTNDKPKIAPSFDAISQDKGLQEDFLSKLEAGTAEYSVVGNSADLTISLSEFEHDFLLEKIQIDGVDATEKEFQIKKNMFFTIWVLNKKIEGITSEGKSVEIKFIGKTGFVDDLTWKFKLKSGNEKPSVPRKRIYLGIGNYGAGGTPFTTEFLQALKDNTEPTIELYGKDVKIYFGVYSQDAAYLEQATFQIDGGDVVTEQAISKGSVKMAVHTFHNVSKDGEHTIIAKVIPTEDYSGLEYKFKVKILTDLPEPSAYIFGIDGAVKPNGYKTTFDKDFVTLIFQTKEDIVQEVRIGKGPALSDADKIKLEKRTSLYDGEFYEATKDIDLSIIDFEDWIIEVTPKESDKYPNPVKYTYKLKGTPIDDNNPLFIKNGDKLKIVAKVAFKAGIPTESTNPPEKRDPSDYGAESVDFTAYTMSKKSKVKAIRVHEITGIDMPEDNASELNRDGETRKLTGNVLAYTDKPTKIKLWGVGADDITTDPVNAVYTMNVNPLPLYWGYRKFSDPRDGKRAYAEIQVSKAKIKKNKVHILIAPWTEEYGFNVDIEAVGNGQSKFEKIGRLGRHQDIFRTSLDVAGMNTGEEKEIQCRLVHTKTNIEAIVYKIKITMKD